MTTTKRPAGSIAFFGHNANDAAIRRRVSSFIKSGFDVAGYMPRRGSASSVSWPVIDLGETRDNAYIRRLLFIRRAFQVAIGHRTALKQATFFYARNLDMLILASRVRDAVRSDAPMIYECLDVHSRLTGKGLSARALRRLEKRLLSKTALVVVSSPMFVEQHFERYYPKLVQTFLLENRLVATESLPSRPKVPRCSQGPIKIGWFGNIRCRRSFDLLRKVVLEFDGSIEVHIRGYPATSVFPDLESEVANAKHIHYHGQYEAPRDLANIYGQVDITWSCDWYEAGANSVWLLPNRIYEGGYFSTPAIALDGTQTAQWLRDKGVGFFLTEPVEESVRRLFDDLLADRSKIERQRKRLLELPNEVFVEPPELPRDLFCMAKRKS